MIDTGTQISKTEIVNTSSYREKTEPAQVKLKYQDTDLDEMCLWLYSIYEETAVKSA